MTDPRRPGPPRPPIGDPIGRPTPRTPATPFSPGDTATPDIKRLQAEAAKMRDQLKNAQLELTRMKDGPGPDGTPPAVREVTRADGQWPFLLIRSTQGDTGERPLEPGTVAAIGFGEHDSPDIMFTPVGTATDPKIVGRAGFPTLNARFAYALQFGTPYDVWVHVWNLGHTGATGVRVRVYLDTPSVFLGGANVDLGDRLSKTAHLFVKAATYPAGGSGEDGFPMLFAVVECMTDVATGDRAPGMDRHVGHRRVSVNIPS